MMDVKNWCKKFVLLWFILLMVWGGIVYLVDPYFHFHAPLPGMSYEINKEYQQNDGIIRNFDYEAMIIGTSTSLGFSIGQAEQLWNKEFIRVSYPGGGFKILSTATKQAIKSNPDLEMIIRGLDPIWFITHASWADKNDYPEYLYDDIMWNDVKYLYNYDVFINDVVPEIIRTIQGKPHDTMDVSIASEPATSVYVRGEKMNLEVDTDEKKEYRKNLVGNLHENVVEDILAYPEMQFVFFIPPYSIAWWDSLYVGGGIQAVESRISFEEYVYKELLQYENVKVFAFNNEFEMICADGNYTDEVHYTSAINAQILQWIYDGKHEITKENYKEYIDEIYNFYMYFDYDSYFEK